MSVTRALYPLGGDIKLRGSKGTVLKMGSHQKVHLEMVGIQPANPTAAMPGALAYILPWTLLMDECRKEKIKGLLDFSLIPILLHIQHW